MGPPLDVGIFLNLLRVHEFDFVFSNTTLHNFKLPDLFNALKEIERISKKKYICVESYRNEKEQFGVQCWALTAETIIDKATFENPHVVSEGVADVLVNGIPVITDGTHTKLLPGKILRRNSD